LDRAETVRTPRLIQPADLFARLGAAGGPLHLLAAEALVTGCRSVGGWEPMPARRTAGAA